MSQKPSGTSGRLPRGIAGGAPRSAADDLADNMSGSFPSSMSGSMSGSFAAGLSGSFPASSFPVGLSDSQPEHTPLGIEERIEPGQHALVLGCGIAGMTAAAVLSKYFQRVTILERDLLPEEPKFRAGKPQGRHAHVLLGQGLRHLEALFPGLTEELRQAGALPCQWGGPNVRWYHYGGWRGQYSPALTTVSCSVNLIEWALRRRLQKNSQIHILTECTVSELLADGSRITGLRVQSHRKGRGQKFMDLNGRLVVDATGRRSIAPEWLSKLGLGPVPETKIDAFWGYASRYYERPTDTSRSWTVMAIHPTPPYSPRIGGIFPLENKMWLVSLAGSNRDYPPDDDAGFLEFARGLAQPDLFEAIRDAKPVSGIYGYRFAENRLRHFDQLKRHLEGFIALGDAVCQFNPIYGQGMSVAAIGAVRLDRCLRDHLRRNPDRNFRGFSRDFQRGLARDLRVPWLITTSEDLRYAKNDVPAKRKLTIRFLQGFVQNLLELGVTDYLAYRSFLLVMHLVSSPLRLLHPLLLIKVLLHALFASRRPAPPRAVKPAQPLSPAAMSPRPTSGEAWPALNDASLITSFKSSATPTPAPLMSAAATKRSPSASSPATLPVPKPPAKFAASDKRVPGR